MRFNTRHEISLEDLSAMTDGVLEDTISDMDFLETLAAYSCFVVTPWVLQARPNGGLRRMTQLSYNIDGRLDKPRILVAVARQLQGLSGLGSFGGRFSA